MNAIFKSALNQIKAEEALVQRAEIFLKDSLSNNKKVKFINLFKVKTVSKLLIAAVSFLVIVIGGSSAAYAYYQTPVAYLSLDINPSVELGVNSFGKVVTSEGCNEDGQAILVGTNVTGSTVEDAIQSLILSANGKGYIAEDGSCVISLTSETNNTNKAITLQMDSKLGVNQALEKIAKQAIIQTDNVALTCRDEAKQFGITPGKLNLIYKLQTIDPTATIDNYKDASVKEIMMDIKLNDKNEEIISDKDNSDSDKSTCDKSIYNKSALDKSTYDRSDCDKSALDKSTSDKSTFDKSVYDKVEYSLMLNIQNTKALKDTKANCATKSATDEIQKNNDSNSEKECESKTESSSDITSKKATEYTYDDSITNDKNDINCNAKASSENSDKVNSDNHFNTMQDKTSDNSKNTVNNSNSNNSNHSANDSNSNNSNHSANDSNSNNSNHSANDSNSNNSNHR